MKHITLFATVSFLISQALGQCNAELSIDEYVAGGNTVSNSFTLAGNLQFVDIELNWSGGGSSWPADLAIVIEAPNGQCVAWWGWQPTGIPPGCNNLGDVWPPNWTTTAWGNYSFFINTSGNPSLPSNLSGSGDWTISFTNTWSQWADYDMDITLGGVCAGECFDPMACNFVPDATIPYNDLCEYAIDWYPSGLYDCDGNCYLDFDGDGICNALEIPGCQEEWACNYNPNATDPPLAGQPCVYPENDDVDCDGNSLLPQFLTQPQNATVSCSSVPVAPVISAQPAPAALIYHGLFPVDCYDDNDGVDIQFSETIFAGSCPGNYTIDRFWLITDCHGHQNSMLQTITVVDNLPPVVLTSLDADTLDCNDPVVFEPLIAEDACGGTVTVVGEPSFVSLPGTCDGESVEKKYTTIKDQCGNQTTVQQVLVIEDNDAPFWLNEPDEQIVTNNLDGEVFDVPVADDICSDFEVNMTSTYQDGLCPLSVVLTRTFVATDQCGNTSAPFIQTITEATDLTADVEFTAVNCHDGNDGTAEVTYQGGVAPYTVDWGGYNPSALPAGNYTVEVNDANLCSVEMEFLITEPSPFTLDLEATVPECNDPMSGSIAADINGGSGNVSLDWGGINPNGVEAGTYTVTAADALGCQTMATVVVPPADIPESLELTGNEEVVQGDSAAYYYEYTLGSTYEWWFEGAIEEQVLATFAISVLWDTTGFVCVRETNQDGCVGDSVCMDVTVLDDVWSVGESTLLPRIVAYPNPASDVITVTVAPELVGQPYAIFNALGAQVAAGRFDAQNKTLDVKDLPAGQYLLKPSSSTGIAIHVLK